MATTTNERITKSTSVLDLMEKIVDLSDDMGRPACNGELKPYVTKLAKLLGLLPMEALLLSVFVDRCDDNRIRLFELARHFDCRNVALLSMEPFIDSLVSRKLIKRRTDEDGDCSYRVPRTTINALREGKLPEKEKLEGLLLLEWIDRLDEMLRARKNDEINDDELQAELAEMIDKNQHLDVARKLKSLGLRYTDLLLYLAISMLYIKNYDNNVRRGDICDYFDRMDFRSHLQELEAGTHILMCSHLVEHGCIDGQVDASTWCLTSYSKTEVFAELNLKETTVLSAHLTHPEDIVEKPLFYNASVTRQVDGLRDLLNQNRMAKVMKRLDEKGMRKGFTCLFYGGPGTGKTETAMQLAKATGRDVMLVDVPSIRSKWVGETEKNIKQVFERYESVARKNDMAPILLFNEADALLNKRNEGCTDSVDKMENAMQNIILQAMENLEGIMIATTNLTGSLDEAFERRFLYKIEFEKPTPVERCHIWKAMLPELTDDQALMLAQRFDFSGGQIENIARKRIVADILADRDDLDMDAIVESCKTELIAPRKKATQRIGF